MTQKIRVKKGTVEETLLLPLWGRAYETQNRKNFYEDSERHQSIAASFLETAWFDNIVVRDGLLFLAGGVLMYFEEEQIREFFLAAADHFGTCDFYL